MKIPIITMILLILSNITTINMETPHENKPITLLEFFGLTHPKINTTKDIKNTIRKHIVDKTPFFLCESFPHKKDVTALTFNTSSAHLASVSKDNIVRIFDTTTEKKTHHIIHDKTVNSLSFNKEDTLLATGANDNKVHTFVIEKTSSDTPKEIIATTKTQILSYDKNVNSVCFNPQKSTLLAIGLKKCNAYTFDINTMIITPYPHNCPKLLSQIMSFDNTGTLLTITARKNMRIFNIKKNNEEIVLSNFNRDANHSSFHPYKQLLAIASPLFQAIIFNIKTKKAAYAPFEHTESVKTVFFDCSGKYLITRATDNIIRFFNIKTHQEVASINCEHTILALCISTSKNILAISMCNQKNLSVLALSTNWSLEQILLKKIINTWFCIAKPEKKFYITEPDKNNFTMEEVLHDIAGKTHIDEKNLIEIWKSFSPEIQKIIWKSIYHRINKTWPINKINSTKKISPRNKKQ